MKLLSFALPLTAALPAVLPAQSLGISFGNGAPVLRGSLGPLSVSATIGGGSIGRSGGASDLRASSVIATADRYLGTRYVYGGETPRGFDCSGFVQYVYGRHGLDLPRTSREQARAGTRLPLSAGVLRPGDLMFFASEGGRIDHVAIYAGRNRIIHSSSSGRGVRYDDLSSSRGKWFLSRHVASRRVISDGRGVIRDLEGALTPRG